MSERMVTCFFCGQEVYHDEDKILAWLLIKGYVFMNEYQVSDNKVTTVIYASCNDVFAWGCADAETIDNDELVELFEELKKDERWGSTIWVCKKRNGWHRRADE